MKKLIFVMCVATSIGLISGCQGMKKRDVGAITGAGAGALVGSAIGQGAGGTAAIVGGAVLGGVAGHHVGKSMENN